MDFNLSGVKEVTAKEYFILRKLRDLKLGSRSRISALRSVRKNYDIHTEYRGEPLVRGETGHVIDIAKYRLREKKQLFKEDLSTAMRQLLQVGVVHDDIYAKNITFDGNHFYLIDYDKMGFPTNTANVDVQSLTTTAYERISKHYKLRKLLGWEPLPVESEEEEETLGSSSYEEEEDDDMCSDDEGLLF